MKYTDEQLNRWKKENTLLSYYKYQLAARGYSVKYLNRDFLSEYLTAYARRGAHIAQGVYYDIEDPFYEYRGVMNTPFYQRNGGSFCAFLEIHAEYEHAKAARG